jgi:hypothetical protein
LTVLKEFEFLLIESSSGVNFLCEGIELEEAINVVVKPDLRVVSRGLG